MKDKNISEMQKLELPSRGSYLHLAHTQEDSGTIFYLFSVVNSLPGKIC